MSLNQCALASQCALVRNTDATSWLGGVTKLTVHEVFAKFGINIENDRKNRFFWNIHVNRKVVITEELLVWLGYTSKKYYAKKHSITHLLKRNPDIQYSEIPDEEDPRKTYYVLDAFDFEGLIMQMRTPKIIELRKLFTLIKWITVKYMQYEKEYERISSELLRRQNNQLVGSVNELKSLVLAVRQDGDERERRAEEERRKAEERECRAEEERKRAEERSIRLTAQIENTVKRLRKDIAPNVVPTPVNSNKRHRLGLFRTGVNGEWYLMRRQRETWKEAERRLRVRSMVRVQIWDDVSHAVDIGNLLKENCRYLTWRARGNVIRVPENYINEVREDLIVEMIEDILRKENAAHHLADALRVSA